MSSTSLRPGVKPRLRVAPAVRRNDAELVAELSASFGTTLDDWQVDALKAGCGVRPDGFWAVNTLGCNVSRQNGKSWILCARALAGALIFNEKVIVASAHEQKTSRLLFQHLAGYFENFDELRRRVKSIGYALGREEIRLRDGTWLFFPARTRNTLRGWSIDAYLADEAQLLTDQQWEALRPAMSARPNSVAWLFGTSPQLSTDAEVFGRLRAEAHAGTGKRLAWVEYGAEPGCHLDDRDQWAAANPGRIGVEAMEAERRELSEPGFARERLNLWPADRAEVVIDADLWAGLLSSGPADDVPPLAIAVDASPDRAMAIAGAWSLGNGRTHVELLGVDRCDPLDALQFVTDRATGRRIPVVIDGASPAAALVPALTAARVKTVLTTGRDMARACGAFCDDVAAGKVSHAGQPALDAAVAGARRRPIGDAGAWAWDRRPDGGVFLAPLVAATLSRFGAVTAGRPRSNRAIFV
ncbi:hypothetical protein [Mycobacterium sp. E787]|uniref:hypothetical protein n=1 Tax=Mycobacterium sp. E787 TaxID=1834150 RepID=UPI00080195D9|nr:hypothetical protein [Mycobacterium sp. E787]OBI52879.1 hypothetical protein A5705_04905 [Mycobacterium sp. E787]